MKKFAPIIISCSLIASLGSTAAKPFATARRGRAITTTKHSVSTTLHADTRDTRHSSTAALLTSIPRGGDLGPLSANVAAKALVGFTIANAYPMWRATEATASTWGCDELSGVQKDLFKGHAFNMLSFAISSVALLNGAFPRTAIGLWALLTSVEILSLIIEGTPAKYNTSLSKGVYINLLVCVVATFGNLLDKNWSSIVNKVLAVLAMITMAVGLVAPQKVWGTEEDGEALTTLAMNNWMSSNAGIAALLCPLIFLDAPPASAEMIGYSHVPFTLLSVYNAIFSKAAKEIMVAEWVRYFFAVVMTMLVSATLL